MKSDIQSVEDIQLLIRTFYSRVVKDPVLAPKFAQLDWDHHMPIMDSFWSSMLLGSGTYQGNPFQKHIPLNLSPEHFVAWLALWHQTIDELYDGRVADEAKMRAQSIAGIFQHKLGLTPLT